MNVEVKVVIGVVCVVVIFDNCSLILNFGIIIEVVVYVLIGYKNIIVVINNMNVVNILLVNLGCEIMVIGGVLWCLDGGLVGELIMQFFE